MKKIPCEVYSRVVGYLRPIQNWNEGKKQEFKDRQTYRLERSKNASVHEMLPRSTDRGLRKMHLR